MYKCIYIYIYICIHASTCFKSASNPYATYIPLSICSTQYLASRLTPKLKGLISANGFFNSPRVQKALRGEKKNKEFLDWLEEERGRATILLYPKIE